MVLLLGVPSRNSKGLCPPLHAVHYQELMAHCLNLFVRGQCFQVIVPTSLQQPNRAATGEPCHLACRPAMSCLAVFDIGWRKGLRELGMYRCMDFRELMALLHSGALPRTPDVCSRHTSRPQLATETRTRCRAAAGEDRNGRLLEGDLDLWLHLAPGGGTLKLLMFGCSALGGA